MSLAWQLLRVQRSPDSSLFHLLLLQSQQRTNCLLCCDTLRSLPANDALLLCSGESKLRFWYPFQCVCACTCVHVCVCVPEPLRNSPTPARCPTIQLNSDATCPEMASDSLGQGLSPTRLPSASNANGKPRLSPVLLTNQL